jgi:ABC-type glycerol-3-phosphate transport system permease component
MILYVIFGGTKGAGIVGIVKMILIYITMIVSAVMVLGMVGGLPAFVSMAGNIPDPDGIRFTYLFSRGVGTDIGACLSVLLGVITTQTYAQGVLSGRTDKDGVGGALISAFLIPPIGIGGILVGLYMRANAALYAGVTAKTALTAFITAHLPPLPAGIILGTLFITVVGTFLYVFVASLAAYSLSKLNFPGRKLMFSLVVTSLMFHSTVNQVSHFIILSTLNWVDTYLAIIIPILATPLGLYLIKQFMESNVHDSVLESARLDGASEFRIYWTIAMPMVKPAVLTLIVQTVQSLWNTGASIYIHSEQLKTFNYAIQQIVAGGVARAGAGAAATVVMMLVPIMVFVFNQSKIVETMGASGMKD